MGTQAAVLAGFTTTCLIEITIPDDADRFVVAILHTLGVISICANISCVSLSTMAGIWGTGKALRGIDGSMDEAVEGMSLERNLIFNFFAWGLVANILTVMAACFILMEHPVAIFAFMIVSAFAYMIFYHTRRIQNKFNVTSAVRLDDLTAFIPGSLTTKQKKDLEKEELVGLISSNKQRRTVHDFV